MTKYWCVNFDLEVCLQHGIGRKLWLMQYQYADDHGNDFQGGTQIAASTSIWRRMKEIQVGDRLAAYLPAMRFFAVATVIAPRRRRTAGDRTDTIDNYVERKRAHDVRSGFVYYTGAPAFYEDFSDKWRHPDDPETRYAQRIDVDEWRYYVPGGAQVRRWPKIPPYEVQKAAFRISKSFFERIERTLAREHGDQSALRSRDDEMSAAVESVVARRQGFQLDSKVRKALEQHAMDQARRHFESQGYIVEDHSQGHSYDFFCKGKKGQLYVEVKGTQTSGDEVILTRGEVDFARQHPGEMALFLLHSIRVLDDGTVAGGKKHVIVPWDVADDRLKPVSFEYDVPR